jgi:hypothetical protein
MNNPAQPIIDYLEKTVMVRIDEIVDLGGDEELWRLYDYLWERLPVSATLHKVVPDVS